MKNAKLWIDWSIEAGEESVCHRYFVVLNLKDEEYNELYQVWSDNNNEINSWGTDWKEHYGLFDMINIIAYNALNDLLKEHEPDFVDPLDVFWEIAEETDSDFWDIADEAEDVE